MTTFDNSFKPKISHKYICANCDYSTSKKSNYDAHKLSTKHYKNNGSTTFDNDFKLKTSPVHICEFCDKTYNDRAGLWRHNKKCTLNTEPIHNFVLDKELFMLLIKENRELTNMMMEVIKNVTQK